ncbi:alanine--tRNA ligase [Candidatus Tremblaya phenacola]|uniref:Alanine--tRNA ligase n=1 Tax=Candidatus Tremblayella phenacoccinincola TaxID=1010676 RepID=A0A2G0V753_9PROT|nr:alanine--tRNA ligase [Candidatus Tremblaya phenacola]PHN16300.1 Alanine--tRNA ligase [Candidatus Tremblaya phenacola]
MDKSIKAIKNMFLNFFKKETHIVLESSPIIPNNGSSLLFTNAGMNQFKDIYLDIERAIYSKVATSQYCLRLGGKHNDLNAVGFTNRHHTLFEMLGNFSFGFYFKYETIRLAWKLLTSERWFNIHKDKLLVTVYYLDREAYDIWTKDIGMPKEKVFIIADTNKKEPYSSDNFWYMGDIGPCGPCSEVFYDYGEHMVEKGCGSRYVEVWNLVFMQYNRQHNNLMIPLDKPSVDTGMGLERIAAVLQKAVSTFKTDIFSNTIAIIKRELNISYLNDYMCVIADHIRTCFYIIKAGIYPSNEGRGYVLRRVIRRMIRYLNLLGIEKACIYMLVYVLKDIFIDYFEDRHISIKHIETIILYEEVRYYKAIIKGLEVLLNNINRKDVKGVLDGKAAFYIYDTYGLPVEFIFEICIEKAINIDKARLIRYIALHKSIYRKDILICSSEKPSEEPYIKATCIYVGYNKLEYIGLIKDIFIRKAKVGSIYEGQYGSLILTKTAYYPETSGQAGDIGELKTIKGLFKVTNTKLYNKTILHIGKVIYGFFSLKETVLMNVDAVYRKAIKANHSAVHILTKVLCSYIKKNLIQKDTYIESNYIRLDYICGKEAGKPFLLNNEEAILIEEEVNEQLVTNMLTVSKLSSFIDGSEYIRSNIISMHSYVSIVRVVNIYGLSIELCKGMHTKRSGSIGIIYITAQYNLSKASIRIEAVTGVSSIWFVVNNKAMLKKLKEVANSNEAMLCAQLVHIKAEHNRLEREVIYIRNTHISFYIESLIKELKDYKDNIVVKTIGSFYTSYIYLITKCLIDKLRAKVIILNAKQGNSVRFIIGITDDLLCYIKAKDILDYLRPSLSSKGGGSLKIVQGVGEFIVFKKEIQSVSNIILTKLR